jgi:uncharacterized spore protein YtfJ
MSLETMAAAVLDKLKSIAQTETVIGKPIQLESLTLIPVSKVSVGFGLGGQNTKSEMAGTGGGLSVEPIAFLAVSGDSVRIINLSREKDAFARAIDLVPEVLDLLKKGKKDSV